MSSEWTRYSVAELQAAKVLFVEDGNHGGYRPLPHEFSDVGVSFIRAADMEDGRVLFESAGRINSTARNRIRKGVGHPGDVILSHKGTVGKVALVPTTCPEFVCSPQTTFWRTLDETVLDRRFLYAYLQSQDFKNQLASRKGETDMADYVSLTAQRQLTVFAPPIEIQRTIGEMSSALYDRITLLRETNATLEAIAQALFKSWFVDFDPVRARQGGLAPEGMDEATAALFPDEFEESELGTVPRGWRVAALDTVAEFLNGLALQKFPPESDDEWLPVIKIAQLRKGDTVGADRASKNIKPEYIIQNGDVLFSWSGSLEVELWCGGAGALNQHLFKVTSDRFAKWFYFFWTRQHLPHFQQIAASKATTMGHIQRKHLTEAKVLVPDDHVLSTANKVFEPLLSQLITNALQAQTLATLRDTLLPRLISGQLRLPETEAAIAAAL